MEIDEEQVVEMVQCGRARWKIENEHNNVLKHHGIRYLGRLYRLCRPG